MSQRMLDLLRDLPAALGDLGHGDPDQPGRVLAADVVRWAAEEIARLREALKVIDECFADMKTRLEEHLLPGPPGPETEERDNVPLQK